MGIPKNCPHQWGVPPNLVLVSLGGIWVFWGGTPHPLSHKYQWEGPMGVVLGSPHNSPTQGMFMGGVFFLGGSPLTPPLQVPVPQGLVS